MFLHKIYCSVFGIGYIGSGGGSVAAGVWCLGWMAFGTTTLPWSLLLTVLITGLGIWSSGRVETVWGKDSSRIVVDEVAGMAVSLLWIPITWKYVLISWFLFRFFDILKPLFIRKMEKLPGGWGVMGDDLLAGIYANLVLQLFLVMFRK